MMDLNLEVIVEDKDNLQTEKKLEDFGSCEFEEKTRNSEERNAGIKPEVQSVNSNYEDLEATRYRALELDMLKIENELVVLKRENDELKERIFHLECERKVNCANENMDVQKSVDLVECDEADEKVQILIENRVLQCEKEKAERDAALWKQKYEELVSKIDDKGPQQFFNGNKKIIPSPDMKAVSRTADLRKNLCTESEDDMDIEKKMAVGLVDLGSFGNTLNNGIANLQIEGTPPAYESKCKHIHGVEEQAASQSLETGAYSDGRVRKQLIFEDHSGPNKKIAPCTPRVAKSVPVGVIDIDDSDDDLDMSYIQKSQNCGISSSFGHRDADSHEELCTSTPKRKRASNVVNSDSESDDDDDVPISRLKKLHHLELPKNNVGDALTPMRRRIRTLREAEKLSQDVYPRGVKHLRGIPTTTDTDVDDSKSESESEDAGSDSEDESMSKFIISDGDDDDDTGDNEKTSGGGDEDGDESDDGLAESEDLQNGDTDYRDIMSRIRRTKDHKTDWVFEGDMLAAFGKDPELCMKAVCALYRQQTADEKVSRLALHTNRRGFSKLDALRGSTLGELLTGGDPKGDLVMSVDELQQYDPKAIDLCRTLALHYSKQLFEIYQNKEDPLFLPR